MTDWQLLECYAQNGDPEAFAELVRRHMDVVYAVARRNAGPHAEDVVQAVFILLAQKARKLRPAGTLVGWLYQATRLCCANLRKMEKRRAQRERAAAVPEVLKMEVDAGEALAHLDAGLGALETREREAVLLRYFERLSFGDVGLAMGISQEAARKRSERGLEKLRQFFVKRGFALALVPMAGLVDKSMAAGAPPGFVASALAAVKGHASAGVAGEIVEAMRADLRRRRLSQAVSMGGVVLGILWAIFGTLLTVSRVGPPEGNAATAAAGNGGLATGRSPGLEVGAATRRASMAGDAIAYGRAGTAPGEDFVLGEGTITGRIVDALGKPMGNVQLRYTRRVGSTFNGRPMLTDMQTVISSDATGEFTLREIGFLQGRPELNPPVIVMASSTERSSYPRGADFMLDLRFPLQDKTDIRLKRDIVWPQGQYLRISDPEAGGEEMAAPSLLWSPPATGRGR